MSGGSGLQFAEAKFSSVRDPRSTCGCSAHSVQRLGHHLLHIRGGSGTFWTGSGPKHSCHVQGDEYCCRSWTFSYTLQSWKVSFLVSDKVTLKCDETGKCKEKYCWALIWSFYLLWFLLIQKYLTFNVQEKFKIKKGMLSNSFIIRVEMK